MRFLVLASVLAFVAAEPESFHHAGAHATAGYVKHMNGAVVPEDTVSVKAAKGLHMAAKHNAAMNGFAMPYAYQHLEPSFVKPFSPLVQTPKVVSYKAPELVKPVTYTKPMVYTKPVITPQLTYATPSVHHVAAPVTTYTHPIATTAYTTPYVYGAHHLIHKREAEADAESDAQLLYTNAYTTPYTYANPLVYNTPYTTYSVPKTYTYTHSPYMTYGYPYGYHTIAKRDAEAEAEGDAQYFYRGYYNAYNAYPYTTTYGYPYTYGAYNTYGYRYLY